MNIFEATNSYESWLGKQLELVPEDLQFKHQQMGVSPFMFLRATFYRWAQTWREVCPKLVGTKEIAAVGDLHLENFGTWRDTEGRLIWGINDFDEAYPQPWVVDLLRLATSALIAAKADHLNVDKRDICKSISKGYWRGLRDEGGPFVLAESHQWLRELAQHRLKDPTAFWSKLEANPAVAEEQKQEHIEVVGMFPVLQYGAEQKIFHRVAGLGSLGRHRWVAITEIHGGRVAREIKATAPSACAWNNCERSPEKHWQPKIIESAVRVRDPMVEFLHGGNWIMRRLSPDCSRIDLSGLPEERDEYQLLNSMGYEIANVHLGTSGARATILNEQESMPNGWLYDNAKQMVKQTLADFEDWRKGSKQPK